MTSFGSSNYIGFSMDRGAPALPAANGPLAAVPRPRHTAALGVVGERTGPNVKLGERGASKGALPGTTCSFLGKGAYPQGGGIPNIIGGVSLPGVFVRVRSK